MASFPTSVKSFASRSNGQAIDAGHVNDLQDEVNAIEDGYVNGTARLNSSASTLASLDVNGNSTLASSITLGSIPYVFPSSGGSTGQVLACVSTSGSTMRLEWRAGGTDGITASGGKVTQIAFAAAQSASADVNTLDDYEEGTWTPTIVSAGGGAATYTTQNGSYVKVGQLVYVNAMVTLASKGTLGAGAISLGGLPFAVGSVPPAAINFAFFNDMTTSIIWLGGNADNGTTTAAVYHMTAAATTPVATQVSDIGAVVRFMFSITFRATA